ncbi:hypothetical protein [Saccharothrix syringae]|uniref:Ig-like domain-containing protein n=1 Tax=Saccharothrix syringae TaxID=103733 RepID=A0A5Q0H710_SACSY|nr:hypothetical protein [Saccharothrix syringae]QFZ21630.1 hypothetical protein EKG83_33345 [Saccharothrix syringae]
MRSATRAALLAASAVTALLSAAAPASAVPTVSMDCETGGGYYGCAPQISGAVPPMTITWTRNGVPVSQWNNRWAVSERCTPGQVLTLTAKVADGSGSASATDVFTCSNGPWP